MEERRRSDDHNWAEIRNFISESREYRIRDEVTQKYQIENIEGLKNQVKTQNGRVFSLEKWKEEVEIRIKARKDNYSTAMAWITIISGVVMAISAWIMIYKK